MSFTEIVITGPNKNALSTSMMQTLLAALDVASGEAALVRGEGDAFSAGLDLREVASLDENTALDFLRLLERTMVAFYTYPAPLVVCVNGHAIAGGCVIALCGDWRIAQRNPKTKIGLNEVALGVEFPPHTMQIVKDRVPPRSRDGVFLGAGLYGVEAAEKHGLIDEVSDDALSAARAKTEALATLPRKAYVATKRQIRAELHSPDEQDARLRRSLGAWVAPEVRERVLRVLDK